VSGFTGGESPPPTTPPSSPVQQRVVRVARLGVGLITAGAAVGVCAALVAASSQNQPDAVPATGPEALAAGASQEPVTLAFGGNVRFSGAVGTALNDDPSQVLRGVAPVLESADLAVVSLGTAVTDGGSPVPKPDVFRAPATVFTALRSAGVDAASMANGHGMDYGVEGLRDSLQAASDLLFPVIGIGTDADAAYRPFVRTVNGQRIAILAATHVADSNLAYGGAATADRPGLASATRTDRLVTAVREARGTADTVVVFLHWEAEQPHCPTDDQADLAQLLARAGADVIVGSHVRGLQGGGYDGSAYVDFGLGNLALSPVSSPEAADSGVLTVTVRGRDVVGSQWHPAVIVDGLPTLRQGQAAEEELRRKDSYRGCTGLTARPAPVGADPAGSEQVVPAGVVVAPEPN